MKEITIFPGSSGKKRLSIQKKEYIFLIGIVILLAVFFIWGSIALSHIILQESKLKRETMISNVSTITAVIISIKGREVMVEPDAPSLKNKADRYMVIMSNKTDFVDRNGNFIRSEELKKEDRIKVFYGGEIGNPLPFTLLTVYRIQLQ